MATAPDDYSEQSFYWHEFIHELAPLNAQTALQYFESSPWFRIDPPSNNQILRMQNTGMDAGMINEGEQLRGLTGIEFAVAVDRGPSLFVIHKRRRVSPDEVHPLEAYYVINNHIQQAPSLYALLSTRLNATVQSLTSSLTTLKAQKPSFSPTKGHAWAVAYDPTSSLSKPDSSKRLNNRSTTGSAVDEAGEGGGSRASSVQREVGGEEGSGTGGGREVSITAPMLFAIRSTATHVQKTSAALMEGSGAADSTGGVTRRPPKSALALVQPSVAPPGVEEANGPMGTSGSGQMLSAASSGQGLSAAGSSAAISGASVTGKRAPPGAGPGTPRVGPGVGMDGGTPMTERKKKKRSGTKDVQTPLPGRTPIPTRSPAVPSQTPR